jgi:sigma-B regulation protein RsbU (phosphoserine phosphatase)
MRAKVVLRTRTFRRKTVMTYMNANATRLTSLNHAASALLSRLAADIHQIVNCSWTAVMVYAEDRKLQLLCSIGEQVDLNACLEYTAAALAGGSCTCIPCPRSDRVESGIPQLVCPVRIRGMVVAVLAIGARNEMTGYSESDCSFVMRFAHQVEQLLQNDRIASTVAAHVLEMQRTKSDLQTARHLQNRLLPNCLTAIPGFDYYGECRPAEDVGGDFFDVVGLDHGILRCGVGDITGKGIAAAIMMAGVQATLHGLTGVSSATILDIVHALNRRVWEVSPENLFATLFCAEIDAGAGILRYVNAGHPPAFLIRAHSLKVERLDVGGTVIGLSRHTAYRQQTIDVYPGDILVAWTDGVSEAMDLEGRQLDDTRLLGIIRRAARGNARDLVDSIMRAVADDTGGPGPADDQTALVVRLGVAHEHSGRHVFPALAANAA